jgi:hypothetical protein
MSTMPIRSSVLIWRAASWPPILVRSALRLGTQKTFLVARRRRTCVAIHPSFRDIQQLSDFVE